MPKTALQVDEDNVIAEYETMEPRRVQEDLRKHGIDAQIVQETIDLVKKRVAEWKRSRK